MPSGFRRYRQIRAQADHMCRRRLAPPGFRKGAEVALGALGDAGHLVGNVDDAQEMRQIDIAVRWKPRRE